MRKNPRILLLVAVVALWVLATVVLGEENPREALEAGRGLYLAGDYAGAEGTFRAALEVQPRDYIALCLLGAACLQQEKMAEARDALDRCLEINQDYVPGLVNLGAWYLRSGEAEKAVGVLESAMKKGQGSPEGYFNLGSAYLALGHPEKAMESLSRAGELGMTGGELSYARSLASTALGDLPVALAEARSACGQTPGEAKYWAHLGRLELKGGNAKGAWEAVIKALKADPRERVAGAALVGLVEGHGAEVAADEGDELQAMAQANPGCFYLQCAAGALNLGKGNLEGAADYLQKAVLAGSGEEQGQAWARLGLVYLLQEKWEAAVSPLEESIKVDGSVVGVHSNLALALFHLGQWERYEEELKQVLQLEPGNVGALVSLGSLCAYRSEWGRAEEQYRLALAQRGDDAELLGKIGRCQLEKKEWQGAIETLERAVDLEGSNAELFFLLGVAYEGRGEWEKALGAYRKVLEIDPNHERAKERIRVLGGGS